MTVSTQRRSRLSVKNKVHELLKQEALTAPDVAARLGLDKRHVETYIRRLKTAGLVAWTGEKIGRAMVWRAVDPAVVQDRARVTSMIQNYFFETPPERLFHDPFYVEFLQRHKEALDKQVDMVDDFMAGEALDVKEAARKLDMSSQLVSLLAAIVDERRATRGEIKEGGGGARAVELLGFMQDFYKQFLDKLVDIGPVYEFINEHGEIFKEIADLLAAKRGGDWG